MENKKESSKAIQKTNFIALIHWLDLHLEETLLVVMLVLIACVTMLQVIVRKIPGVASLTWAEELCRFLWIWSVFLSLPYTIRTDSMLRVGVLKDLLPESLRKILNLLVDAMTLGCMAVLGLFSWQVVGTIQESHEISPYHAMAHCLCVQFHAHRIRPGRSAEPYSSCGSTCSICRKELSTMEQTFQEAEAEAALARGG